MLLSHLASADDPARDDSVRGQVERFLAAYTAMREFWPDIALSLANSACHLSRDIHLGPLPPQISRVGFALYGGNPLVGTGREHLGRALLPAMEAAAPVLGVHDLSRGQAVSYGGTFTAGQDMRIAVVGAGYADGFSRVLSGRGHVCIRGERCPVIGRVCMQMHMVAVDHVPGATRGDAAYLLGGEGSGAISMWDIAGEWGTIPHEVFASFGRNPRAYCL
jgi:alanine racemase